MCPLAEKDNGSQGMDFAKEDARKAKAPVEKQVPLQARGEAPPCKLLSKACFSAGILTAL